MKACPFCGGEADLHHYPHHLEQNFYTVRCSKCGAQINMYIGREAAIEAWERRTSERKGRWLPSLSLTVSMRIVTYGVAQCAGMNGGWRTVHPQRTT